MEGGREREGGNKGKQKNKKNNRVTSRVLTSHVRHTHPRLFNPDSNTSEAGLQSPRLPGLSLCTSQPPTSTDRTLCDPRYRLFLSLAENKVGIRHVCWFQRETVTPFNAKDKQRRRGSAFAKGSPPHGLWRGPRPVDKEPQRWQGHSTATKFLCGSGGVIDLASANVPAAVKVLFALESVRCSFY